MSVYQGWDRIGPYPVDRIVQDGLTVIGQFVLRARRSCQMSQRALAARVGLNQSTISRLERGRLRTFRLVNLARIFGVLYDPLLGAEPRLTRWS